MPFHPKQFKPVGPRIPPIGTDQAIEAERRKRRRGTQQ
jgi:hypothetical protein